MRRDRTTSAVLLSIIIASAGGLAARAPEDEPAKKVEVKSNDACYVCHMPFQKEGLAATHAKEKVWCGTCHGPSIRHTEDENIGATPPDAVFKKGRIDRMCAECHEPEKHPEVTAKTRAARLAEAKKHRHRIKGKEVHVTGVCTDCHGRHWIPPREPVAGGEG